MRKLRYVLLLLLLAACGSNSETQDLIGNWYTCGQGGLYVELYFVDGQYSQATGEIATSWENYNLIGDTLLQEFRRPLYSGSIRTNIAIVTWHGKDHFTLNYLDSDESWDLYRLEGVSVRHKSDVEIKKENRQRGKAANCPDNRSPDEIKRDSIERDELIWEF